MKNVSEAAFHTITNGSALRGPNYLRGIKPSARPGNNDDVNRLKKVLKRAVEQELAPQSLIDAIREKIRKSQ